MPRAVHAVLQSPPLFTLRQSDGEVLARSQPCRAMRVALRRAVQTCYHTTASCRMPVAVAVAATAPPARSMSSLHTPPAPPATTAALPPPSSGASSKGGSAPPLLLLSAEDRAARNAAKLVAISRDFRTDTITVPTEEQRQALALASMGDSVYGEDEDTRALEEWIAELTGMEAALFCASGTMASLSYRTPFFPRSKTLTYLLNYSRRRTSSGSELISGNPLTAS